ncbi:MAG: PIN domain-containing protein [Candidatus Aenigmarchaeota archaeon]|nr:PIN domain-containing protein [Candidatus Aenigmarchaeota archaeon]
MIILDTSFIVSFYNVRDENHSKARNLMPDIIKGKFGFLHISDYIFDETITVIFIRLKNLTKTVNIGRYLRGSTKLLEVTSSNFEEAWTIFKKQKETDFSFTDCTTISLMKRMGIKNIATFDKDFVKVKGINVIGIE